MVARAVSSVDDGCLVQLRIKPGAKRTQMGLDGRGLYLAVRAKPVEGQANKAVIEMLSQISGVRKSNIQLERGTHSRVKQFRITDLNAQTLVDALEAAISN